MSNIHVRPTFGVGQPQQQKQERPEIGAIWERTSKSNNKYMNIRLKLPKQKLQELLNETGDTVSVNLVAFPNRDIKENTNRPNFRIYEELKSEEG
jgi:uncharacterized protein (DUF736 family)